MKFSVLLSIYYKENTDYFDKAMQSIYTNQTIKPNEIILVEDGYLTDELYQIVKKWREQLGDTFKIIPLKENVGLGRALNIGLENCTYELVARMDTDDISHPKRFEKQLKIFKNKNIDICSSWVSEFELNENNIVSYRRLPEHHEELVKFAKKRNPLNHPATMYKKEVVEKAGGYKDMLWFEDYYLWVRMICHGAKFYNIQEALVNMRAGYKQLERRGGFKYAMNEVVLQKKFLNLGFVNRYEFIKNIIIRFIARIVPKYVLKKIYSKIRT